MAELFDIGIFSVEDIDGSVGVGWKLTFYATGTSTKQDTYPTQADADAGTNANTNPVLSNAGGRFPPIWLKTTGAAYKVVLSDDNDVVRVTRDPAVYSLTRLLNTGGAGVINYNPANTYPAGTVGYQLQQIFPVELGQDIATTTIPAPCMKFEVGGYYSRGDGGAALWVRQTSNPSHSAKRQSADGAWWALATKTVRPEQLGAKGDGTTDDTVAITQAISFADEIVFSIKTYCHTGLNVNRQVYLRGLHRWLTVLKCTVGTGHAINLNSSPYKLSDMTVDRSVTATSGSGVFTQMDGYGSVERVNTQNHFIGITFNSTANATARDITSQNNYSDGMVFTTSATMPACQWKCSDLISQLNDGIGLSFYAIAHASGAIQTGPVIINGGSYANTGGGWVFSGDANTEWNDVNFLHVYSSFDNSHGFRWFNCGANNQMYDVFAEWAGKGPSGRTYSTPATNVGSGMVFVGGVKNDSSIIITGTFQDNAYYGIEVGAGCKLSRLVLNAIIIRDSGQSGTNRAGIALSSTLTRTTLTNVASSNLAYTSQLYGIQVASTAIAAQTFVWGGDFAGNATSATNVATTAYGAWIAAP